MQVEVEVGVGAEAGVAAPAVGGEVEPTVQQVQNHKVRMHLYTTSLFLIPRS